MGGYPLSGSPFFTPSARIRPFTLRSAFLLGLLLVSLILVACGESQGSTPTAVGTLTGAPSSNDEDSDTPSFSEEKRIFVGADRFEEVPLPLKQGDVLKIEFKAEVRVSPGFGGTAAQERAIHLAVLDPDGNELAEVTDKPGGSLELTAEVNGEHKIVLLNPFQLEALTVTLNYSVNM